MSRVGSPSLERRVAVVTGAASGIGRAIALEMAARGAAVAVADIDDTGGRETVELLGKRGARCTYVHCDVTDESQVEAAMMTVAARLRGIDVLVNNAGIVDTQLTKQTRLDQITTEIWDQVFAVNVRGQWLCIKHAVPHLQKSPCPAIINCASVSSYVAYEGESAYCASKAAVLLLTQSAALDFRRFGIRCNCYCPGTVQTPLIETALSATGDAQAAWNELAGMHLTPEPRLATPEEVAHAVCFLASEDAAFINGTALRVDGGALAWRGIQLYAETSPQGRPNE